MWKQKFLIHLKDSNKEKAADVKKAILLSCIGDEGLDLYKTFDEIKKNQEDLLEQYDNYFFPSKILP